MSDSKPEFVETPEAVVSRLVYITMHNLFYTFVYPQFPTISWKDCPRRIVAVLMSQAYAILPGIFAEYERTLKLNGFVVPSLLNMDPTNSDNYSVGSLTDEDIAAFFATFDGEEPDGNE